MDDLLEALGVTLVEVDGLALTGCWVETVRVGLIREGVGDIERTRVLDYFAQQAIGLAETATDEDPTR